MSGFGGMGGSGSDTGDDGMGDAPEAGGDMNMDAGGVGPSDVHDAPHGEQPAGGASDWKPPSREEWERTQKHAQIGQRFEPFADKIDRFIGQGFTPQQARAEAKAEKKEEEDDFFKSGDHYNKGWERVAKDKDYFRGMLHRESRAAMKDHLEKQTALERRLEEMAGQLAEARGALIVAPHQFQVNKEFERHREAAMKIATTERIPFARALKIVQQEERLAKYEAAEKAQKAAQAAEAGGAPPARRVAGAPKEDRSLHASRAPGGAGVGAPRGLDGKGSKMSQAYRLSQRLKGNRK